MSTLMESWPRRHRIDVDEYHRMGEVGLLAPDARVELLEGEIIDMAPIGTDHNSAVNELARLFFKAVGDLGIVQIQGALQLDRRSELQPDIAVLALSPHRYRHAHPAPADALLLVEVSDRTLGYDRNVKVPLYASHGIPEVWVVDLRNSQLHRHRSPQGDVYRDIDTTSDPGVMPVGTLPGVAIDLTGLFAEPPLENPAG